MSCFALLSSVYVTCACCFWPCFSSFLLLQYECLLTCRLLAGAAKYRTFDDDACLPSPLSFPLPLPCCPLLLALYAYYYCAQEPINNNQSLHSIDRSIIIHRQDISTNYWQRESARSLFPQAKQSKQASKHPLRTHTNTKRSPTHSTYLLVVSRPPPQPPAQPAGRHHNAGRRRRCGSAAAAQRGAAARKRRRSSSAAAYTLRC